METLYTTFVDKDFIELVKQNLIDDGIEEKDITQDMIGNDCDVLKEHDREWLDIIIKKLDIHNWLLIGVTQYWDGKRDNYGIFGSFSSIVEKYDDFVLSYKKTTDALTIELYHHDGKHDLKMYSLDEYIDSGNDRIYLENIELKTLKKHAKAITAKMFFDVE